MRGRHRSRCRKRAVCARVSACPARGDEAAAAARMMMCAATASPAAASSGPGGEGFFPAATISSSPAAGALFMPVPEGSVAAAGLGLAAADSRGHYQLLLSGRALADRYRRIYTAALSDRDQGGSSAGHPASRCVSRCPCATCLMCVRVCVCVCATYVFTELSEGALDAGWSKHLLR